MRRGLTVIAIAVSLVLPASPADARFLWHRDPKDAKTEDLVGVRLSTFWHDGVKMLRANADFADPGDFTMAFEFDSRGDEAADYQLGVEYDGGSAGIFAGLYRLRDHELMDVTIHVTRGCLDCTSYLPVWWKLGALHPTKHVRWRVDTGTDQAPDHGWYSH